MKHLKEYTEQFQGAPVFQAPVASDLRVKNIFDRSWEDMSSLCISEAKAWS